MTTAIDLKFWQVDSFTNQAFKGNPAAVVIIQEELSDKLMQNIAAEMNLSETAFILEKEGQNPLLRWFTPMLEIDLCGHATLAAAHILMTELYPEIKEITFETKFVGPLQVQKLEDRYSMDFPSRLGNKVEIKDIPSFVLEALSTAKPSEAYKSRDLMLVYDNDEIIYNIKPDFNALLDYQDFIIVTAKSKDERYDFISRFFCADDGIAEDPVTGSAHCTSGPYWANKLQKTSLKAYQASKRGGELELELKSDRIMIRGKAITVIEGKVNI